MLGELLDNFNENEDEHLLLKGELLRKLGRFDAARKILNQVSSSEYLAAKEFILDLAENEVKS